MAIPHLSAVCGYLSRRAAPLGMTMTLPATKRCKSSLTPIPSVHPQPVAHLHDEEVVARHLRRVPHIARVDQLTHLLLLLPALLPDQERRAAREPFPPQHQVRSE